MPGQRDKDEQVAACDPEDRLRATEGGFIMTDIADVESVAEPANNSKARSLFYLRHNRCTYRLYNNYRSSIHP